MKKKLLVILMILVLTITAIVATACSEGGMISKNKERDFKQVTASVTYANRAAQVDKLELSSTIYNFVYQYYSYYSQGYISQAQYQSVLDNISTSFKQANESLAETEAYTLKCIDELYKYVMANGTEEEKAAATAASTAGKKYNMTARIKEIESVLPKKDLIAAVEAYNKEMQESFDSFREAYDKEVAAASSGKSTEHVKEVTLVSAPWKLEYEKGESLNESGLKVGVVYEGSEDVVLLERGDFTVTGFSSEEVKDEVEVTVTFANKNATFNVKIIAAKPARPKMPTEEEEEEKTVVPALFETDLEAQITAARGTDNALYKALTESKRRLEKQMTSNYRTYEYYYLSKLKDQVVTACEEIKGKAAEGVSAEDVLAEYNKKLEEQKQALLLETSTYKDAVDGTGVKTQIVHEDGKIFYVQNLLFKITDDLKAKYTAFENEKTANKEALEAYLNYLIDQTGIYVSNVEYDKDATCEDEECACTACANYKGENPGPCTNADCACKKCPNKRYVTAAFAQEKGLTLTDGTINVLDMLGAVYADLADLSATATAEERAANLEKFKKWVYMCNDDEGFFTTLTDGKLGYSLSMDDSSYVENFTACARALAYGDATEKAEWHVVGTGVGSFGYCYTEYGIHVIMLSGYALDPNAVTTDLGDGLVAISIDTVTDNVSYKAADGSTPAKGTLKYGIVESLESKQKDELVGAFKKEFYQTELENDVKITYKNKVYKDLIKSYSSSK